MDAAAHTWVLLPGMDGTGTLFDPFIRAAPGRCTVIDYPHTASSYDELVQHVRDRIPSSDFIIVAESFSGPIGILLAAIDPPGLRHLVLVATFASSPRPAIPSILVNSVLFAVAPPSFAIRLLLTGRDAPPDLVRQVSSAISSVPASVMAHRARLTLSTNVRSALAAAPCGITYLQATNDRLVTAASMAQICSVRPDTRCVALESAHLLLQTHPEEAWAAITAAHTDTPTSARARQSAPNPP